VTAVVLPCVVTAVVLPCVVIAVVLAPVVAGVALDVVPCIARGCRRVLPCVDASVDSGIQLGRDVLRLASIDATVVRERADPEDAPARAQHERGSETDEASHRAPPKDSPNPLGPTIGVTETWAEREEGTSSSSDEWMTATPIADAAASAPPTIKSPVQASASVPAVCDWLTLWGV
jgi:hypothetical protein